MSGCGPYNIVLDATTSRRTFAAAHAFITCRLPIVSSSWSSSRSGVGSVRNAACSTASTRSVLEDLRDRGVGARGGEVDAVEAHALVEPERAAQVEADDRGRRSRREPQRELAAHEGPQPEDRDDARSARTA